MARVRLLLVSPLFGLLLGGCVPMMVANALGTAAGAARKPPQPNEHLQPEARQSCTAHASQYGAVNVIDVQQASPSKIIVWGTVENGGERRSFQCDFGTKITAFKLRPIPSQT